VDGSGIRFIALPLSLRDPKEPKKSLDSHVKMRPSYQDLGQADAESESHTSSRRLLVGALEHVLFSQLLGISSSQLLLTPAFFRGVGRKTTNQLI